MCWVMAAKKCGELIPLCHPLAVESVTVDFDLPVLEVEEGERVKLGINAVVGCSIVDVGVSPHRLGH